MEEAMRLLAQEKVYQGRMLTVMRDQVQLPNGARVDLEIVRHPGAAAIVPLDEHGFVVLERQVRYAAGGWLLEVPAGKLDKGEAPEDCARRELREETGMSAATLTPLGFIWPSPGFTDERIWLYLATGLGEAEQALESDEVLTLVRMPLSEAVDKAFSGEIGDAKSVCALLRAWKYLQHQP
jgi:ADP-ribose pyrophosphatase